MLTNYERETIVTWNCEESKAEVYTCNSAEWLRAKRLGWKEIDCDRDHTGRVFSRTFEIPKSLAISNLYRNKRKVSEKQMKVLRGLSKKHGFRKKGS